MGVHTDLDQPTTMMPHEDTSMEVDSPAEVKTIKYVFIPADTNQPIEEKSHTGAMILGNDSFNTMCRKFFASGGGAINRQVLEAQMKKHAADKGQQLTEISDDMFDKMLSMSSCDIFPLLLPLPASDQMAVSVYVDDKGISKSRECFFLQESTPLQSILPTWAAS